MSIGGTPEALKRYNDALGIKRASQAQNDWQPLIRWIAGQAWDQSNRKPARISKFAAMMQYWMLYLADDPKYTPYDTDEAVGPGTSSFARWVLECHGYGGFANDPPRPPFGAVQITDTSSSTVVNGDTRHRRMNDGWRVEWFVLANRAQIPTWHPIYIHLKSGAEAEAKAKELKALVPAVKALAVQPTTADYRIVGVLRVGDAHPLGVAVPPDHPGVNQWQSQRYASGERVWLSLPVGAYDTN